MGSLRAIQHCCSFLFWFFLALPEESDDEDDTLKKVVKGVQAASKREQRDVKIERSGWMTKQGLWFFCH
jgi:hypothetical protein